MLNNPTDDDDDIEECAWCSVDLDGPYYTCDITKEKYCASCFNRTLCGRGYHAEECATEVYQ